MKLVHLYPDLMNLYGDYGNLAYLRHVLTRAGAPAEVVPVAPGQPLPPDAALVYMGPGTEPARDAALTHLRPLRDALAHALAHGTPMLFTGNSWLTLGKSLRTADGRALEGLGLFDFQAAETEDRYTHDAIALSPDGAPAVGYQNRCDAVTGVASPLFRMELGAGNAPGDLGEGLLAGSLRATHLIGPLLVKNPHLLSALAAQLGVNVSPAPEAALAYQTTLSSLRHP